MKRSQKNRLGATLSSQNRGTSLSKGTAETHSLQPNKSFEFKKVGITCCNSLVQGFSQKLVGSLSQQTLEALAPQEIDQGIRHIEQNFNTKIQKVFDRIGFLEDALSRVELQQDSMRPVLKMIEQNNGKASQIQQTKKVFNKENSSNSSSFISQANGLLLDKLTKPQT